MQDTSHWDWEVGDKQIDVASWKERFGWVEEPYASPDGESVAAIIRMEDDQFTVCLNGTPWAGRYDKAWHLRFLADGRAMALVSQDGEWTVAVNDENWPSMFGYVWHPLFSPDGSSIATAVQNDMRYAMALNGDAWKADFANATYYALSPGGDRTAAAVQVRDADSGEIHKFQEGTYSVAVDGVPWDASFVNVWHLAFSADGRRVAAEVRRSLYDYTIAVDGQVWTTSYGCVWAPSFNPKNGCRGGTGSVQRPLVFGPGRPDPLGSRVRAIVAAVFQCRRQPIGRHRGAGLRPLDRGGGWRPLEGNL